MVLRKTRVFMITRVSVNNVNFKPSHFPRPFATWAEHCHIKNYFIVPLSVFDHFSFNAMFNFVNCYRSPPIVLPRFSGS